MQTGAHTAALRAPAHATAACARRRDALPHRLRPVRPAHRAHAVCSVASRSRGSVARAAAAAKAAPSPPAADASDDAGAALAAWLRQWRHDDCGVRVTYVDDRTRCVRRQLCR
jgi:hypothetical protein